MLQKIGPGEGQLNLIAWEGYLQPQWVKPFEQQTGCQVNAKYAGSSDEMVALIADAALYLKTHNPALKITDPSRGERGGVHHHPADDRARGPGGAGRGRRRDHQVSTERRGRPP